MEAVASGLILIQHASICIIISTTRLQEAENPDSRVARAFDLSLTVDGNLASKPLPEIR
ncbi:hypothetical protein DAPPUDRAFT_241931 [Daphnia pulex]|uniref:Uncharacterized protein n=1 Tax=Daphnia pulex TaxID=6669 RepID=E9GFE9_DAPPU|nr:hypothetical protein DAPPUDRAFT_241931 [Daphnia pulex]|eukprot:EFX81825.1 hypothetical protein DAPPUDRAFT_241931 [Daphnia pulex]